MNKTHNNRTSFPTWFINEIANEEDRKKAINNTLKLNEKIEFICPVHGTYKQEVRVHIKKSTGEKLAGCKLCNQKNKGIYNDWFIDMLADDKAKEKAKNNTLLSTDKVNFICKKHGVFSTRVGYITKNGFPTGVGCPLCGKEKQTKNYSLKMKEKRNEYPQWFIDDIVNESDKQRAINKDLKKTDKILFHCPKYGDYYQSVHIHLKKNQNGNECCCRKCAIEKIKEKNKTISVSKRQDFPSWFIDELAFENDKIKAKTKQLASSETVGFICNTHGVYYQLISNHITLSTKEKRCGCPKCGAIKSKDEDELFDFIHALDKNAERRNKTIIKDSNSKHFLELDIYCPDKKIAFEFNGSFWHSDEQKDKNYHFLKFKLCEQQNIRLISIFEKDWIEKKNKILNFIRDLFVPQQKIFARNTIINTISNEEAKSFCEKYHLGGFGINIKKNIGLFFNNELISVMSFSKPRFTKSKNNDWEINRFCTKSGVSIIGGASKLFSYFLKTENPSSVITYSDCNYFSGNVYKNLGFTFLNFTSTPYYWFKNKTSVSREKAQPKILKEKYPEVYKKASEQQPDSIESFIMHTLGFTKVSMVGNKKWIYKR